MHAGTPRQAHSAARRAGVGATAALAWPAVALPALFDLPADPSDRGTIVSHIRLAPGAGAAAPQIIVTPRLPRPAPPGGASQ